MRVMLRILWLRNIGRLTDSQQDGTDVFLGTAMNETYVRLLITVVFGLMLSACGGGSSPPPAPPAPVDTMLDWDQGNWDEENWQ